MLLLTCLTTVLSTADTDAHSPYALPALRRHYRQAAHDEAASRHFHQLMSQYTADNALVLAYKAAAEAILAKHTGGLFDKLDRVKTAGRLFDHAVSLDPKHPEIRFLRFSIESNLPSFLGASKHVQEDKGLLVQTLLAHPRSGLDAEAFQAVRDYLVQGKHLSDEQAHRVRQLPI
ncbi:hypothetical protein [Hymenobacter edaphi]|uniref:Uncharacterized protein n=1 Tax=Hymenobacter edaphi TaxID=2211146 RepID=A0A328BGN6_9BACT|nr:hypothetical protein [Hymenobacter edaphi]RAK66087.1 hypothetical protein DLM85_15415 [Hymenobacter edaphi]